MDRRTFLAWMSLGGLAIKLSTTARASLASNLQSNGIVFYIAPEGSDTWSGKLANPNETKTDGPFATFWRSRDAIRELKRQQGGILKQPVTVFARGGTYYLEQPLLLEPEDSGTAECPVIFAAFPSEIPIFSGGKQIKNWRKLNDHLWVATLPNVKTGKWYFRLLRTNGEWALGHVIPNSIQNNLSLEVGCTPNGGANLGKRGLLIAASASIMPMIDWNGKS